MVSSTSPSSSSSSFFSSPSLPSVVLDEDDEEVVVVEEEDDDDEDEDAGRALASTCVCESLISGHLRRSRSSSHGADAYPPWLYQSANSRNEIALPLLVVGLVE